MFVGQDEVCSFAPRSVMSSALNLLCLRGKEPPDRIFVWKGGGVIFSQDTAGARAELGSHREQAVSNIVTLTFL